MRICKHGGVIRCNRRTAPSMSLVYSSAAAAYKRRASPLCGQRVTRVLEAVGAAPPMSGSFQHGWYEYLLLLQHLAGFLWRQEH